MQRVLVYSVIASLAVGGAAWAQSTAPGSAGTTTAAPARTVDRDDDDDMDWGWLGLLGLGGLAGLSGRAKRNAKVDRTL
jgi:MYXO-CTERM domain-containing protein